MKTWEELLSDYDRASERISLLNDLIGRLNDDIRNAFDWMDSINQQMDDHPDKPDDERFENRRDPETKLFSAMQGGTDGG